MGYRDTAGQHAGTAATHAGTAATKAGEASASAQLAGEHKQQALQAVADAQTQVGLASAQAQRAEAAAESIAGGPITSLQVHSGLKTGAVSLGLADLGPQATDAQMQAGTVTDPLLMSPAGVRASVLANAPKTLLRSARTSNVQLVKADNGKLIDITSGTFTQTFAAAATLGDGWSCYLKNGGAGDITLDPNASETIDGLTSFIMYPGEVRLVQCDGTALRTVVLNSFYKVFTASANFIKPPGYSAFQGLLWGGGGGGGLGATGGYRGGGGGGGACNAFTLPSVLFSTAESIAIGSGGGGGSAGSTSSIGTALVQAFGGGAGGISDGSSHSGGGGGGGISGSGGNGNPYGGNGNGGDPFSLISGLGVHNGFGGGNNAAADGTTIYGGGGGGGSGPLSGQSAIYGGGGGAASGAYTGGTSKYGGAGGGSGSAGTAPGGGGGGGSSTLGGVGARGELRIWGII
jgi:hypothetical protein